MGPVFRVDQQRLVVAVAEVMAQRQFQQSRCSEETISPPLHSEQMFFPIHRQLYY
jgi:hypothetical protein